MRYTVSTEVFEGPFDLLLHLVQKDDLNIHDIPISKLTSEYLATLETLKALNLEVAGEFLVMAATLIRIKSRMLLPAEAEEETEEDPRLELVNRLLEYKRFKEISKELELKAEKEKDHFYRPPLELPEEEKGIAATLFDLLDAFQGVLKEHIRSEQVKEILREPTTIEERIRRILTLLEQKKSLSFHSLFRAEEDRMLWVVTFLALLELVRMRQVTARQREPFGEIRIYRRPDLSVAPNFPRADS